MSNQPEPCLQAEANADCRTFSQFKKVCLRNWWTCCCVNVAMPCFPHLTYRPPGSSAQSSLISFTFPTLSTSHPSAPERSVELVLCLSSAVHTAFPTAVVDKGSSGPVAGRDLNRGSWVIWVRVGAILATAKGLGSVPLPHGRRMRDGRLRHKPWWPHRTS